MIASGRSGAIYDGPRSGRPDRNAPIPAIRLTGIGSPAPPSSHSTRTVQRTDWCSSKFGAVRAPVAGTSVDMSRVVRQLDQLRVVERLHLLKHDRLVRAPRPTLIITQGFQQ